MRKRVVHKAMVLILALSLCLTLMVPASAATVFPDVPASHWAYDEIQKCCSLGIVKGTSVTLIADGADEKEAVEAL